MHQSLYTQLAVFAIANSTLFLNPTVAAASTNNSVGIVKVSEPFSNSD